MAHRSPSLLHNLISVASGELVSRAVALVAAVVVARYLGPGPLGMLIVAQGMVMLASAVSDGGLTLWATRALVTESDAKRQVVPDVLRIQLLLALLMSAVLGLIAAAAGPGIGLLLAISVPYLLVQASNLQYVLHGARRFAPGALARSLGQTFAAIVSVVGAAVFEDARIVALAFWLGPLITDLVILIAIRRVPWRRVTSGWAPLTATLRAGIPYVVTAACGQLMLTWGSLVLGLLTTPLEAGLYASAYRLVVIPYILIAMILQALYPEMVVLRGRGRLPSFVQQFSTVNTRLAATIALLLAFTAEGLVESVYGSAFADSVLTLQILALSIPVIYYNALASRALTAEGHEARVAKTVVTSAGLAVVICPFAVLWWGSAGAALSYVTVFTIQGVLLRRTLRALGYTRSSDTRLVLLLVLPGGAMSLSSTMLSDWGVLTVGIVSSVVAEVISGRTTLRTIQLILADGRRPSPRKE